jgi:Flp pilus assembly protein TadD
LARRAYGERQDYYAKDALAFALYRNGELDQAKPLARELLSSGVPDARLLYHAGLILRDAGDAARGGEAMQRALALNPRFDLRLTGALHDTVMAAR